MKTCLQQVTCSSHAQITVRGIILLNLTFTCHINFLRNYCYIILLLTNIILTMYVSYKMNDTLQSACLYLIQYINVKVLYRGSLRG